MRRSRLLRTHRPPTRPHEQPRSGIAGQNGVVKRQKRNLVKFQQRYQNSHRTVISGIIGRPIDADALDSLRIRLFYRLQGALQIDFQTLFALMAGDQWDLCIR